jgi:hypothetical protein
VDVLRSLKKAGKMAPFLLVHRAGRLSDLKKSLLALTKVLRAKCVPGSAETRTNDPSFSTLALALLVVLQFLQDPAA